VRALDRDRALVPDLDPDPVNVDDRVHLVDRTITPDLDFIGHHIGDVRHQFPGCGHTVHLEQMCLDIAGRHPAGITGEYEFVDLPDPPRPFRHDLRLELAIAAPAAPRS
jgi:hypothetical protein